MGRRWRGGRKPRDVGTGVVCASLADDGAWLSLGAVHPAHGLIELSAAPEFDESRRGEPDYVRHHRARLADGRFAFLALEAPPEVEVSSTVRARHGSATISQELRLRRRSQRGRGPAIRLRFQGRLERPPLAMITETGRPPPATGAQTRLVAEGGRLRVTATELPAEVVIIVVAGTAARGWRATGTHAELPLEWPAEAAGLTLRLECEVRVPATPSRQDRLERDEVRAAHAVDARPSTALVMPAALGADLERIRRRALAYVRDCTALRVASGRVAILTDHRLLPLSWTRDAYYQALLLLRAGDVRTVADHLRWLWLTCDRPDGWWARSHHADGRRKDDVYQADQQLYPLLELADCRRATGRIPAFDAGEGDWPALVAGVLDGLAGRLSADGLLPTAENAADDPADLPYLLANQILAVYTLERLAEAGGDLHLGQRSVEMARRIRAGVERAFTVDGPFGRIWAYAVDGRGGTLLYHDANDLPAALAPLWSFCPAGDPIWRGTMDFAFSPANDAYAAGPYGGLGSRHTPGVWSLGLIQEWVARSVAGEIPAATEALRRLVACSLSDGSLPEASDPASGRLLARHWFAWPGATLAALLPPGERVGQ